MAFETVDKTSEVLSDKTFEVPVALRSRQDRARLLTTCVAIALCIPLRGGAMQTGCDAVAGNLLAKVNCGFDNDVGGWTSVGDATIAHVAATGGTPASAAMKATSGAQGSLSVLSRCVPIAAATAYQFNARMRLDSGAPYFCAGNVWQYSDLECSAGQEPLGTAGRPPAASWAQLQSTMTTARGVKAAQVRIDCSGSGIFSVLWDEFVVAPAKK
jgi:hypothetical protein